MTDKASKRSDKNRVLIFDMPVEHSIARVRRAKDRIEQRPVEYHETVRRNFLAQVAAEPERYRLIDAGQGVDAVQQQVLAAVNW